MKNELIVSCILCILTLTACAETTLSSNELSTNSATIQQSISPSENHGETDADMPLPFGKKDA